MAQLLKFKTPEPVEVVEDTRELLNTKKSTFEVIMDSARKIQSECRDFVITGANETNIRINDQAGVTYQCDMGEIRNKSISRYALGQLCSKIGVPAQYVDKCIKSGRLDLAQENVTSWISDYNNDLFIREYNDTIRGVLTPRFSVCDTPDILDVLTDVIDPDAMNIKGYFLSPERFHLRMTEKTKLNVQNEDLFAGIQINSSDVGRSILSVEFLIYKQVCTNGLCLPQNQGSLFIQKHIGISAEAFREGLKSNIELIPEISAQVSEYIEQTRNSGVAIKNFDDEEEINAVIKRLRAGAKMSEEGARSVINLFEKRTHMTDDFQYENNQWGLINAITEVSKEHTLERRLELEKYAGSILIA